MTYELIPALSAFAFVTSVTPGPNNLMLMTSGANYGFRRTIPHMLGVAIGFTIMVVLVGIGLMGLFDAYPVSHTVLKVAGITYLLWLAWKIANSGMPETSGRDGKPMTWIQGAAFQWVNPKAWQMALTAITLYAPDRTMWSVLMVAVIFGAINLPTVSSWTVLGQQMNRVLSSPKRLRMFNVTMALLLVGSVLAVL
jgi:threonine/homoserine/homoserine lactone efflux protein